jgi:hypothetical protein
MVIAAAPRAIALLYLENVGSQFVSLRHSHRRIRSPPR